MIVLLDSGPLGLLTSPRVTPRTQEGSRWLRALRAGGHRVLVPEIADFEVLLRTNRVDGIARLNALGSALGYLPLTTAAMCKAAEFWAEARQQGRPTADPHALDADVRLAAQATTLDPAGDEVVIATMNVGHLARLADAREWVAIG